MDKKKKAILGLSAIIAIVIIGVIIIVTVANRKGTENAQITEGDGVSSKTMQLSKKLSETSEYNCKLTLDDNNKIDYSKKGDKAYNDFTYDGEESKFIIKNGDTYSLDDKNKQYYVYKNNEMDLTLIEKGLGDVDKNNYKTGKEKIEKGNYKYEEFNMMTDFLFKGTDENEDVSPVTRFYYKGDELKYIKTIIGDYQELIKVEISYNDIQDSLFEIPSDYKEE